MKIENVNPSAATDRSEAVSRATTARASPSGGPEIDELSISLEQAQQALKDGSVSFQQIASSISSSSDLEFLLMEALVTIVKSKLDEFERYLKDSLDQSREGVNLALDQADDIRSAGAMAMGQGIAGGVMAIAGSGVSMVGAGAAMKSSMSGGEFNLGRFQSVNQKWMGVSTATNSVGQISGAAMKYTESEEQAAAEIDRAESAKQIDNSGRVRDLAKSEGDFIQQLIQLLMQLGDMQHETRSKVIG